MNRGDELGRLNRGVTDSPSRLHEALDKTNDRTAQDVTRDANDRKKRDSHGSALVKNEKLSP